MFICLLCFFVCLSEVVPVGLNSTELYSTLATLFQSGVPQPGCPTGKELKQLFLSFSMLGPVVAKPPSTWTPVMGDVLSPSLPTLAIQVLSSFLPLLQLLPSYATVEEQTRSATDSALLLTRQLSEQHLPSPPLPQ